MENPATWTSAHHVINEALKLDGDRAWNVILALVDSKDLIGDDGALNLLADEIDAIIDKHKELMARGMCGLSLPAKIHNFLYQE